MSAPFKKKKPSALLLVFFLLVLADRFFFLVQDGVAFSDASNVAVDGSRFAKNKNELPVDLQNDSSIGFTKNGNVTLTLLKSGKENASIPLVARKSSDKFSFRASLDNCKIEDTENRKWELSYGEKGKQGELSIVWDKKDFTLVDVRDEENYAYVAAGPEDQVDVLFDKNQASAREKDGKETGKRGKLQRIVPVDMQAMVNGSFSLSISRLDSKCSITLEFDKKKFGLLKPVVTTPLPQFVTSTIAPSGVKNKLYFIIGGVVLLIVCLIGLGIGGYFLIKRRRDKKKDPEKNSAPPVDDSQPAIGVSSFSTNTPGKTITAASPPIPAKKVKTHSFHQIFASELREIKEQEEKDIIEAAAADKESKEEGKVASKKVLEKEDKKSSKPAKAEGKPGPQGKKVYVPLIDMDNSLKSLSKKKTPGTLYENF